MVSERLSQAVGADAVSDTYIQSGIIKDFPGLHPGNGLIAFTGCKQGPCKVFVFSVQQDSLGSVFVDRESFLFAGFLFPDGDGLFDVAGTVNHITDSQVKQVGNTQPGVDAQYEEKVVPGAVALVGQQRFFHGFDFVDITDRVDGIHGGEGPFLNLVFLFWF